MDEELEELKVKYGDERRSEIDYAGDPNFNPLDFIPNEKVVVTLSQQGYVKRLSLTEYRSQRRGGQGKRAAKVKEGDIVEQLFVANSHDTMLCFTNLGKCLTLPVYSIPEASRSSKGKAIVNLIALQEDERVEVVLPVTEFSDDQYVFMATEQGYVKKTPLSQYAGVNRKGKRAIILSEGDSLIGAALTDGNHDVMLFSDEGKATRFAESDVRSMGCSARGVFGMRLEGAKIISMLVADDDEKLVLTACENGYGKCTPVSEYSRHARNTKGMIAIQTSERNGRGETIVKAESGEIRVTPSGIRYAVLKNGRRYDTSASEDAAWRVVDFDTYELRLQSKADQAYASRDVEELSVDRLLALDTPVAKAEFVWRLCWPLAALNLALLAIPLSYTNPRAGKSISLVLAVLIFILYLNGISVAETWVKTERVSWITALVTLNGLVFVLTALLFVRRVWLQRWIPLALVELPYRLFDRRHAK